jgi:hypothetical protein
MAAVILTKMWLVDTVSEAALSCLTGPGRPQTYGTAGDTRIYAGGRRRSITHPGVQRTWGFELIQLFPADLTTLLGWHAAGSTVFARDHRGQSMYGTFFDVEAREYTGFPYLVTASIVLSEVDAVEGV